MPIHRQEYRQEYQYHALLEIALMSVKGWGIKLYANVEVMWI